MNCHVPGQEDVSVLWSGFRRELRQIDLAIVESERLLVDLNQCAAALYANMRDLRCVRNQIARQLECGLVIRSSNRVLID